MGHLLREMGPFFSRKFFYLLWGLRPRPKLPRTWAGTDFTSTIYNQTIYQVYTKFSTQHALARGKTNKSSKIFFFFLKIKIVGALLTKLVLLFIWSRNRKWQFFFIVVRTCLLLIALSCHCQKHSLNKATMHVRRRLVWCDAS